MSKHLSSADLEQLSIQNIGFHIIKKDQSEPIYIHTPILEEAQYDFFENIVRFAVTKSEAYTFLEEENDAVLLMIEMLEETDTHFAAHSRRLTDLFWDMHESSMSDGILCFAILTVGASEHPMLFIAKMDFAPVLQVEHIEATADAQMAYLRFIHHALVEHESAIQKAALIDIDARHGWDVLALDRQKKGSGIADYFKRFLHIQEKEINAILTTQVVSEVQKWASKNSDTVLLPAEHVADYKERAVSYLRSAAEFDTHELMDTVIADDENIERKQDLSQSLYAHLENKHLTDRPFAPEPEGIKPAVTKNRIQTKEGVTIQWDGNLETANISIQEVDGQIEIVIRTADYTYK